MTVATAPTLRARELAKRADLEDALTALLAHRTGIEADTDLRPRTWAKLGLGCVDAAYRLWLARGGDLQSHLDGAFAVAQSLTDR